MFVPCFSVNILREAAVIIPSCHINTDTTFEFSLNFFTTALVISSKCTNKDLFVNQASGP